jgi:molybdopterin-guanine dinucleotide biosynthesis protein A
VSFSAVILAGGSSSRMGCDKAFLVHRDQPLLARQLKLVRAVGAAEIFISGRPRVDYTAFSYPVLEDRYTGCGPLAGVERALAAANHPLVLVLAVDLPWMSIEFLHRLGGRCSEARGAVAAVNGELEPLAAFYPKTARAIAEESLRAGFRALRAFAERCAHRKCVTVVPCLPQEASLFTNWNCPEDLKLVRSASQQVG